MFWGFKERHFNYGEGGYLIFLGLGISSSILLVMDFFILYRKP